MDILFYLKPVLGRIVVLLAILLLVACADKEDRKAKYFNQGMALYEQGNYVKAKLEFKNVLQIDPQDSEAYYMFGQIEEKDQNLRSAYALFLRTTELNPEHIDAQLHLGRLYVMSGQPEKALAAADIVLTAQPESSGGLVLKGLAQARLGDKQAAIDIAKFSVEVNPGDVDSISLLSALYADQGNLKDAIRLAKQGVENNPEHVAAYLLLARLYDKANDDEGAIKLLTQLVKLEPETLSHRKRLAAYYLEKKQTAQAEKVLQESIQAFPDDNEAKLTLISYLIQLGDKARAETELRGFIKQAPDDTALQIALANFLLEQQKNQEAKDVLNGVIENAAALKDQLQARTKLAALLLSENDADKSLEQVELVLEEDAKNIEALMVRGAIALNQGDPDRGIADLRTILREDPGHVRALRLMARGHVQKGELALARVTLEKAIEVQPQEVGANIELAQLLVQSGDPAEALTVLEKMRRFSPDDLFILTAIGKIHIAQKNWSALSKLAKDLQQLHPNKAMGNYYLGLARQGNGQLSESVRAFEEALKREPNAVEPLVEMAKSLLSLNKSNEALTRVREVIKQTPNHFLALNLEGEILISQKRYADAEKAFKAALAVNPQWISPYQNLARLYLAANKVNDVEQILLNGYEKTGLAQLGMDLAGIYEKQNKETDAIAIYEKLLSDKPNLSVAANNLAMLLVKGEPGRASLDKAGDLVKGFELENNPIYLDTLGWVYFKQGDLNRAVRVLERTATAEALPEMKYHLAEVYAELGRKAEALKLLEQIEVGKDQFAGIERVPVLIDELKGS